MTTATADYGGTAGTGTPQLAERTMKARAESVCPRCRITIYRGQRIGLVAEGWLHVRCVLGFKPPMIGWHSGV